MGRDQTDGGEDPGGIGVGTVTSLAVKGGSGERVSVYLDGKRAFDLSRVVVESAGLHKDEVLTEERRSTLVQEDEPYRARELALAMLARRELPSSEVISRLCGKGISERVAQDEVGWLRERGYVDDGRYMDTYFRDRTRAGWGAQRILGELRRKGLDKTVVEDAWTQWVNHREDAPEGQLDLVALVSRKFGGQFGVDPKSAERRAAGFLARRGHDWETIATVLSAVKERDG